MPETRGKGVQGRDHVYSKYDKKNLNSSCHFNTKTFDSGYRLWLQKSSKAYQRQHSLNSFHKSLK